MPSSYTGSDGIEQIGVGEQPNTWGSSLNNDMALIDQALDAVAQIPLSSSSTSIDIANGILSSGRSRVIVFTGSPSTTVSVSVTRNSVSTPVQKFYYIVNESTQSVIISNGTGTALTIPAGTTAPAFCDGLGNVVGLQAGNSVFSSLTVTGNESVGGNLGVTGSLTVQGATNLDAPVHLPGGDDITILPSFTLHTYIDSLIPAAGAIISSIALQTVTGGSYIVTIFGGTPGSRFALAVGHGTASNGNTIAVPTGFNTTNFCATASLGVVSATPGDQLSNINVGVAGAVVTALASDDSGNNYTVTASWSATCWINNA